MSDTVQTFDLYCILVCVLDIKLQQLIQANIHTLIQIFTLQTDMKMNADSHTQKKNKTCVKTIVMQQIYVHSLMLWPQNTFSFLYEL